MAAFEEAVAAFEEVAAALGEAAVASEGGGEGVEEGEAIRTMALQSTSWVRLYAALMTKSSNSLTVA